MLAPVYYACLAPCFFPTSGSLFTGVFVFFFFRFLIHILIAYNQYPRPCLSLSPNFQALTLHLLLFLFPHPSHFSDVLLPPPMNLLLLLSLTSTSQQYPLWALWAVVASPAFILIPSSKLGVPQDFMSNVFPQEQRDEILRPRYLSFLP